MAKVFRIGLQVEVADAHSTKSVLAHLEEIIKEGGELTLVAAQALHVADSKEDSNDHHQR